MKEKLTSVLRRCNINFEGEMQPEMHNFVTKQILSEEIKKDLISVESIGKVEYDLFVKERMRGESEIEIKSLFNSKQWKENEGGRQIGGSEKPEIAVQSMCCCGQF